MSKNNDPLVSIITPAYNAEKMIGETIESVQSQTYDNWEMIVVDDGSQDGTTAVIEQISRQDGRIKLIRQQNAGVASARNRAIESASGELIAFLDADDLWKPEKLAKQVAVFQKDRRKEIGLVYTEKCCFGNDISECRPCHSVSYSYIESDYHRLLIFNFIATLTVMVRRDVLRKTGVFDDAFFGTEDWDLWLRIAEKSCLKKIDEDLAMYRIHPAGISQNPERKIREVYKVMQKHLRSPEIPAWVKTCAYGLFYRRKLLYFYQKKNYFLALFFWLKAIYSERQGGGCRARNG